MKYIVKIHRMVFIFLFSSSIFADPVPAFIEALDSVPLATSTPANDPDDWLMAHVDVETTGLVPGYHEMIDVGIVMTDLEGNEIDRLFCASCLTIQTALNQVQLRSTGSRSDAGMSSASTLSCKPSPR